MTATDLITAATRRGIVLSVEGDQIILEAPAERVTDDLLAAFRRLKPELLPVIDRLARMRALAGETPVAMACRGGVGGLGRCFSCGDALECPAAYGRCTPCAIAADVYYATLDHDEPVAI